MPIALLAGLFCVFAFLAPAGAMPPAAELLPAETVGYFHLADAPDLIDRWRRTQLGKLAADPTMRPFVDQVRTRLTGKFGGLPGRLGASAEDFRNAASGQAAIAIVRSADEKHPGRAVALIDATGREEAATELLTKIDKRLIERGAKKRSEERLTVYDLPPDDEAKLPARSAAVFYVAGVVGAVEGERLAKGVIARLAGGGAADSLADAPAFAATSSRAAKAAQASPTTVTWFMSPFEFEAATRDQPEEGELPNKKDTLAILAEQGFDAIKGIGGVVSVSPTAERDFIHHTFFYAPPKPGSEGRPAEERYDLAMRMAELPNIAAPLQADNPPVELWTPRQVATYRTTHIDLQNAFKHLGTLFDAFFYEGAFETTLTGWERDFYGPKVNVREEVIPYLGERVVVMTDYSLPIQTESERYLFVLDVTDEEALRDPVNRWLKNEPGAERRDLGGVEYWEIVPEDEALAAEEIDPLAPLDGPTEGGPGREERVLRRAAVCLHQNRLVIGSDADFLRQALFGASTGESLSSSADLQATIEALVEIAPGERSGWTFCRTDELFRPTYELIRAGEMPQSQTFFGRLLNRLMRTEEQREIDAPREQKIDGRRLPTFELARRYFGPSARSVRSESDGWLVSGVILSKAPEYDRPAAEVARK